MTVIKLRAGKFMVPVDMTMDATSIKLKFGFNRSLLDEIKLMEGAKWHPESKCWSIKNSMRNHFQLRYLSGENPYAHYDKPLDESLVPKRAILMDHQVKMYRHALTRVYSIIAGEMGTGKSLVAIEVAEEITRRHNNPLIWYVGPKSGVKAVGRELIKWKCKLNIQMYTYEALVRIVKEWKSGQPAPRFVIYDESTRIKTPSAQRSQAAMHIADAVRAEYGIEGYVLLMSGSPAPKSPVDWWNQCETACPGFLKEGHVNKMKHSMALIENRDSLAGGSYPHLVTWFDDEKKCKICGQYADHEDHDIANGCDHVFQPSSNEVARLHRRMEGLVITVFKKDCMDLPEITYREILVKPTPELLRTAHMIKETVPRAITMLGKLRELSDGFQYRVVENSDELVTCKVCHGSCQVLDFKPIEAENMMMLPDFGTQEPKYLECTVCEGTGKVPREEHIAQNLGSPKDEILLEILEDHEEVGRINIWGGFTATIDRLVNMVTAKGWLVLRVDGRGYKSFGAGAPNSDILLDALDASNPDRKELERKYPLVCFIGHPKAGGMALTLTASPTQVYYSNPFDGEARIQSEARFHRAGMDTNRGAVIIDLIMLPSDKLVLDNLKKKKKLQSLTLGELHDAWADAAIELEKSYDSR